MNFPDDGDHLLQHQPEPDGVLQLLSPLRLLFCVLVQPRKRRNLVKGKRMASRSLAWLFSS